jgi:hypothetical protein
MMKAKEMSSIFWAEAVAMTLYVFNRLPMKVVEGMTPYETWYGKKLVVHHLCMFGCIAHVRNTSPNPKKLDDRRCAMVFIGYE